MKKLEADVVVLGGGTAGMNAFRAARKHTEKVFLIEDYHFGTTCARVGCMPSKLLIAAAESRHHALHTDPFGVHIEGSIHVNGREVMQRVKQERDRFVGFVLEDVNDFPQDKIILGRAKFKDEYTVIINDEIEINSRSFVIATGSRPNILKEWEELGDRLVVNDDVFEWDDLPKSIAVMGTGVVAIELGEAFHRLGVKVRVFGRSQNFAGISDPILLKKAHEVFSKEFPLTLSAKAKFSREDDQVKVTYQEDGKEKTDIFDYLLGAIGRQPNVDNIGLENIDIQLDKQGVPIADWLTMQTSVPHIFIAGDASDQLPLLHEASDQGQIAGKNAAIYPKVEKGLRRTKLAILFSDPQIAIVGYRWSELRNHANPVVEGEVSFENQGRSRVMLVNKGGLRLYADKVTGEFLGSEMVGPAVEHLAHLLAWAHQQKMTISEMLSMPFYHPVIEEAIRTALRDAYRQLS